MFSPGNTATTEYILSADNTGCRKWVSYTFNVFDKMALTGLHCLGFVRVRYCGPLYCGPYARAVGLQIEARTAIVVAMTASFIVSPHIITLTSIDSFKRVFNVWVNCMLAPLICVFIEGGKLITF